MTAKGDTHIQIDGDILQCRAEIQQLRKQSGKVIPSFEDIAAAQDKSANAKPVTPQTDDAVIRIKDGIYDVMANDDEDVSNKTAADTSDALSIIGNAVREAEDEHEVDVPAEMVAEADEVENTVNLPQVDSHRLSPEEHDALTADLSEQEDTAVEADKSVPQFDLADQILFEHRKSVSAGRRGPAGSAKKTTPPAQGTVAKVINENKKTAARPIPSNDPPPAMPVMINKTIDDRSYSEQQNRVIQISPAVSNIVHGRENLSSFQQQIMSDIINRDISSHCDKTNLSTVMKSYVNN